MLEICCSQLTLVGRARPAAGSLRPVVHCQLAKVDTNKRPRRGFSIEELKSCLCCGLCEADVAHIYAYIQIYVYVYICVYMCVYVYVYTHVHIYMYIYTRVVLVGRQRQQGSEAL